MKDAREGPIGPLAVRFGETGAFRRQFVDIGRAAHFVSVTGQGGVSQVVRNQKEDVEGLGGKRTGMSEGEQDGGKPFHVLQYQGYSPPASSP